MSETKDLTRIEAFSDGIFAIASTLLVLEIRVPSVGVGAPASEMWHRLAGLWPSYLAFVMSFGTILSMWVNHHDAIRLLRMTSKPFLYANGLLLLMVTFVPFPTAVLARYVATSLASTAVVFYAGTSIVLNVAFLIWFGAMQRPVYLLKPEVSQRLIKALWTQMGAGFVAYVVSAIISLWLPLVGLGLMVALSVFWTAMSVRERNGP